jgi:flavin-dependent dehydrogenase
MTSYDVVVVGGRVAGASTALLLARAGARVAVVDRGRRGSDTVSTHALMRAGVLQLTRWGLKDRVVEAGTPPMRRTLFHFADGDQVRVSIKPKAGVDALYAPRRYLLDQILADAAEEAGADILHATTVVSLLRDANGRARGVSAQVARGARIEIAARTVVGADGIRSVVAEQVGAALLRKGRASSAVLYRYFDDLPTDGFEWLYGLGAVAGLIPTNAGATCVFVATTPARMRRLRRSGVEHAFSALLRQANPGLVERVSLAVPSSAMRGWAGSPGHVRQSWGPGWALVGDAGYFKDPITAHGMTDGLRDAELLTDQILGVLGGDMPERAAMAAYQEARDRLSSRLFAATEEVAGYDWDADGARLLVRRVSSAMSDEVDHLQALPDRLASAGFAGLISPDRAHLAR